MDVAILAAYNILDSFDNNTLSHGNVHNILVESDVFITFMNGERGNIATIGIPFFAWSTIFPNLGFSALKFCNNDQETFIVNIIDFERHFHTTKKPKDNNSTQDNTEITPQYVKILEKEKNSLANQLRDLEWRLDQESKAYHKANDERKQYILEINITKSTLEDLKMKQRYNNITSHYAHNCVMAAQMNQQNDQFHNPRQQRDGDGNIRENHRVLDPRKGPMKKTVGIRTLPSLDQDGD
eukprot:XP_014771645.1 PREDICTED: uncharacterized protein LOC106870161 [Octopus bimaculoides]